MEPNPEKPKKPGRKPEDGCATCECGCSPEHGEQAQTTEPDRHQNAANKQRCGMCEHKASMKGDWICTISPASGPCYEFDCGSFSKKPRKIRPFQVKPPRLTIPTGVRFLYLGRARQGERHQGVMTVAYSVCKMAHLIEIGFSFCSPVDSWVKAKGQKLAVERLLKMPITAPYLYEPRRLVLHIAQALMERRIDELSHMVTIDGKVMSVPFWEKIVPGWSRTLAQRLKVRTHVCLMPQKFRKLRLSRKGLDEVRASLSESIMARMMHDILNLGGKNGLD